MMEHISIKQLQSCNISRCPLLIKVLIQKYVNVVIKTEDVITASCKSILATKLGQYLLLHQEKWVGILHDRMSGKVPLEVGTRGTIGSLLKREIEYFRKLELERVENRMASDRRRSEEMAPGGRPSWPGFRFSMASWRRKKRNIGIRPGICSVVEVADCERLNEIRGFSYLNLRVDSERYDI